LRSLPLHPCVLTAALAAVAAGGCGESKQYANHTRPPTPVTIAAAVSQGRISLSPGKVGAGPITLSVANLGQRTVEVKMEPVDAGSGRAESGPINPQGTAQLNVDVVQGTYRVTAHGAQVSPANLAVGSKRPSAQNDLLTP
jgi:hypothetical protein